MIGERSDETGYFECHMVPIYAEIVHEQRSWHMQSLVPAHFTLLSFLDSMVRPTLPPDLASIRWSLSIDGANQSLITQIGFLYDIHDRFLHVRIHEAPRDGSDISDIHLTESSGYKKCFTEEERRAESSQFFAIYPDCVPVVVEKEDGCTMQVN